MKYYRNIFFVLIVVAVALACGGLVSVKAQTINEDMNLPGFSNASISLEIDCYFVERANYLLGQTTIMEWDNLGIVNDETDHKELYITRGINLIDSNYNISSIEVYDHCAVAFAIENITYIKGKVCVSETIIHNLTLYLNDADIPTVAADGYFEVATGFSSRSYVPTSASPRATSTEGGRLCIMEIAKAEIGYTEEEDNITKYGAWYGNGSNQGESWCGMFISWCAYRANISNSVIACTASPWGMMSQQQNQNRFYPSNIYGGSYTPVAGDLIFTGSNPDNPAHVGLVDKVENGIVYVCDGNWADQVSYHSYAINATDIIGYGHPNYASYSHVGTYYYKQGDYHWMICSVCGADFANSTHIYKGTYYYDSVGHWQKCMCGATSTKQTHIMVGDGMLYDKTCKICGYVGAPGGGINKKDKILLGEAS